MVTGRLRLKYGRQFVLKKRSGFAEEALLLAFCATMSIANLFFIIK